jgi:choline dehydrogenase-like flavoprotein
MEFNVKYGRRWTAYHGYLRDIMGKRKTLTVKRYATVTKVTHIPYKLDCPTPSHSYCHSSCPVQIYLIPLTYNYNIQLNLFTCSLLPIICSYYSQVLLDSRNQAFGVEYVQHGKYRRAHAKKEVILSAGAVKSAHLLLLSGIGPREHLEDMGVKYLTVFYHKHSSLAVLVQGGSKV